MEKPKVTKEYMEVLLERFKYFKGKRITDLTDDEIKEFQNLRNEIIEVIPAVKNIVSAVLDAAKKIMEPYENATEQYDERVLNK